MRNQVREQCSIFHLKFGNRHKYRLPVFAPSRSLLIQLYRNDLTTVLMLIKFELLFVPPQNRITHSTTISNGNRTEWSPIRSVIIQVITKSVDRAAGVRFVYHSYDYRPN